MGLVGGLGGGGGGGRGGVMARGGTESAIWLGKMLRPEATLRSRLVSSSVLLIILSAELAPPSAVTESESSVCETEACALKSAALCPVSAASCCRLITRPVIGSLTNNPTMIEYSKLLLSCRRRPAPEVSVTWHCCRRIRTPVELV